MKTPASYVYSALKEALAGYDFVTRHGTIRYYLWPLTTRKTCRARWILRKAASL